MSNELQGIVIIDGKPYYKKPRNYPVKITRNGTVSAQFQGVIQIDPQVQPFLLQSLHADDTADTKVLNTQENWLISIQDNQNGYNWTDGFVPRAALCGGREFGLQFPEELPVQGNTRITVTIQNAAATVVAGDAYVTLRGWSLFPVQR